MKATLRALRTAYDAFAAFLDDDGWAIASHIALSTLMALFPFLIVITALAGFVSTKDLADEVVSLLLETWPAEVVGPIAGEIHRVMTTTRSGVLTVGLLLAVYFSSNGVEALRIALNRAYNVRETRHWLILRLESIGYVLVAAIALLALGFLVVLGPLIFDATASFVPVIEPLRTSFTIARYALASLALIVALIAVHKWLPAGHRRLTEILPGIAVTIALSLIAGYSFGEYLSRFASTYISTYAGLASAMIALVFLYFTATIFIYGGELNAVIARRRPHVSGPDAHIAENGLSARARE